MSKISSALLVCLLATISLEVSAATDATDCAAIPVNKTAFFNLCPFAQTGAFSYNDQDSGLTVNFSLAMAQQPSCDDPNTKIWAIKDSPSGDDCKDIAVDGPAMSFIDLNNETSGLAMTFPINTDPTYGENRNLVIWLYCNQSANVASATEFYAFQATTTQILIQGSSYYACPYVSLSKMLKFLDDNKYPFVAGAVILGLFICLFGLRLFSYTIFIITATVTTLGSGMLFFEFTKFGTQKWILWVIFGTCLIIGCVLGYLTVLYEKFGFFALGAGLGVVGGFFLYNIALSHFITGHTYVLYLVVAVLALAGGSLALWLWKDIIIIASSIIGSYMMVRAVSILIGGFPNEFEVAAGAAKLGLFAYIYLVFILIISVGGMYYQFREKRLREQEEDDEDHLLKHDRDRD